MWKRMLVAAALLATVMTGYAAADIFTKGRVTISADKATYLEYDGSTVNLVVDGSTKWTSTETGYLGGVTPGTATASKAVVLGASKEIATITSATITTLTAPTINATTIAGTTALTGRVTTTDGVTSGTAKVVGGQASSAILATDNLLASAGASAHVDFAQTYSIPANTLKAGTVTRVSGTVRITDASGTDTAEVKVYIGGSTLTTTTAVDPDAADDFVIFNCEITTRAAPSATSSTVAKCSWTSEDGTTYATGANILVPTNLATNGILIAKASGKWSATTANTNMRLEQFTVDVI